MKHKCTKCGVEKEDSDFPHAKGVRHSWCRDCNAAAKRLAREKFRELHPRKRLTKEDRLKDGGASSLCVRCHAIKPIGDFQNLNGSGWCRSCRTEDAAKRRALSGVPKRRLSKVEDGKKMCMECNSMKALDDFSPSKRGLVGLSAYCKSCAAEKYKDREKAAKATRKYREQNKERHLAAHRVRMFEYKTRRKVTSDGSVTDDLLRRLYATATCYYCKGQVQEKDRTIDHKIPLSKGGHHSATNLVMACWTCNCSKQAKTDKEFETLLKEKNDANFSQSN